MNKYFAKYLPVGGEIKKEDMVIWHHQQGTSIPMKRSELHPSWLRNSIIKKVELFLCTRDIKIGEDFVHIEKGEGLFTVADELDLQKMEGWKNMKKVYKVLGSISPEATWIKENDEFNESSLLPIVLADIEHKGKTENIIKIKGPCGHFH